MSLNSDWIRMWRKAERAHEMNMKRSRIRVSLLSPLVLFIVMALIGFGLAMTFNLRSPRSPTLRPDGVLEFTAPWMGNYHCTPAGAHYEDWPTGQPCIIVKK